MHTPPQNFSTAGWHGHENLELGPYPFSVRGGLPPIAGSEGVDEDEPPPRFVVGCGVPTLGFGGVVVVTSRATQTAGADHTAWAST